MLISGISELTTDKGAHYCSSSCPVNMSRYAEYTIPSDVSDFSEDESAANYAFPAAQDPILMSLRTDQYKLHLTKCPQRKRKVQTFTLDTPKKKNKYDVASTSRSSVICEPLFVRDPETKTLIKTSTVNEVVEHWKVFQQAFENVSHLNW